MRYLYTGTTIYTPIESIEARIIASVTAHLGVTFEQMRSADRLGTFANARAIAAALIYAMTPATFAEVGDIFARDHSTIIYYYKRVTGLVDVDNHFVTQLYTIYESL